MATTDALVKDVVSYSVTAHEEQPPAAADWRVAATDGTNTDAVDHIVTDVVPSMLHCPGTPQQGPTDHLDSAIGTNQLPDPCTNKQSRTKGEQHKPASSLPMNELWTHLEQMNAAAGTLPVKGVRSEQFVQSVQS